jgi:hypothetical protein
VLDPDLKPVKVGKRKIKLGLVGGATEVIELNPEPAGLYCVGKLTTKVDPVKITVAVTVEDHTDVVLCGWTPGVDVVVGVGAPRFNILVVNLGWGVDVVKGKTPGVIIVDDDDDHHVHWHGHGHGRWKWH